MSSRQTVLLDLLEPYMKKSCKFRSKTPTSPASALDINPILLEYARLSSSVASEHLEKFTCLVNALKKYLGSKDPNIQYFVLRCLDAAPYKCLDWNRGGRLRGRK